MEKNTNQPLKSDDGKEVSPKLTLGENGNQEYPHFDESEPEMGSVNFSEISGSELISAGAVDESMLTEEERKQVDEFYKKIDLNDVKTINSYGIDAQKGISSFSQSITNNIKTKEFGEIGDSLRELRVAISSTVSPERKGIGGLFKKGKNKVTYIAANYKNAEANIRNIESDLQKHQQILTKDIYVFDQMYHMNLDFYKELTMYIIAGKKALDLARKTRLVELKEKGEQTGDQLDVQAYRDYEEACKRFEKRLFDLKTTRMVSIQLAPQIRMLQNSDQEVVDKLRSDIMNTIPLWRNQMVLALGISHSRRALDAQSAVTEMTNEMFLRNAETLKQGSIDAAAASENGIVDIETLRKVNADIIASVNEVVKIHEDGTRKRQEAQTEMAELENELKSVLLEAGTR
jgi:uncharacterized protein YaaN involved in tellurite resistance